MYKGKNERMKLTLRIYIIVSSILFLSIIALTIYIKKKYGNYDV
jgi:hypothetical protein